MARITLELPPMLANVLGGARRLTVQGRTWQEALEDAFRQHPGLRVHLLDERGTLRRHVLCFINDENTRWDDTRDRPLTEGDTVTIVQAVSGG
ncbi:MAG: MoaD/ThiS family protein [Planctomycetota bacterium]|jgi:molybdopterin converting factor small subunit